MKPGRVICAVLCVFMFGPAAANDAFQCASGSKADRVVTARATLAGVPAVLRIPKTVTQPPIILWHGFGPPDSEEALMTALPLNDVPAVKVFLGLPLFGAREPTGDNKSLNERQAEDYATLLFAPAVVGAAKELPAVVKALEENNCLAPNEKIALFGFSAGGAAVLVALAERDVPVRAAVTVNAPTGLTASIDALERATKRPYAWTPSSRQLAQRSDAVGRALEIAGATPPPALFLYHGADDTVVTSKGAIALEATLRPIYARTLAAERLKLMIAPGVSHDWTEPRTLQELRASVASWFNARDPTASQ